MPIIIENTLILLSLFFWLSFIIFSIIIKNEKYFFHIPALIFQFFWIFYRIFETGHAPFAGFYESLVFFGFLYGLKIIFFTSFNRNIKAYAIIPVIFLLLISLLLPDGLKTSLQLAPALKSFWIYVHVPVIFIGYVSLTIGFILSVHPSFKKEATPKTRCEASFQETSPQEVLLQEVLLQEVSLQEVSFLNNEINLAFFFITAGIITGGFWAELSWGTFWSWDPKEVCALITWVILAAYFHIPSLKWKKVSIIFAFISMLFMYFGAIFILPGLHSYK